MSDQPAPDAPIVITGLVNRFGAALVHDGLSLTVRRGEILGVVGGSGTGKSVLMRSIIGLQQPEAGHIAVLGHTIASSKRFGPAVLPDKWGSLSPEELNALEEQLRRAMREVRAGTVHLPSSGEQRMVAASRC